MTVHHGGKVGKAAKTLATKPAPKPSKSKAARCSPSTRRQSTSRPSRPGRVRLPGRISVRRDHAAGGAGTARREVAPSGARACRYALALGGFRGGARSPRMKGVVRPARGPGTPVPPVAWSRLRTCGGAATYDCVPLDDGCRRHIRPRRRHHRSRPYGPADALATAAVAPSGEQRGSLSVSRRRSWSGRWAAPP